jgi:hypothetical protein
MRAWPGRGGGRKDGISGDQSLGNRTEARSSVQGDKTRLGRITVSKGLNRIQERFTKEIRVPDVLILEFIRISGTLISLVNNSNIRFNISFLSRSKS